MVKDIYPEIDKSREMKWRHTVTLNNSFHQAGIDLLSVALALNKPQKSLRQANFQRRKHVIPPDNKGKLRRSAL